MRLSVYKNLGRGVAIRGAILKAAIVDTFNEDTAYVVENWAAMISTIAYTLSFALFIKVVYGNVDSVAGYSQDEMLFFLWISQWSFYSQFTFFHNNIYRLSDMVNLGELDFLLSKPLPTLFYLSFRRISVMSILREFLPALFLLSLMIDWSQLNFSAVDLVVGALIFILGLVAIYCMMIIACLPVFWLGRNGEIMNLATTITWLGRKEVPFDGFPKSMKAIFTSILPVLITSGLATSVMLGKSDPLNSLVYVAIITSIFLFLKALLWDIAIKAYSSASS